MQINRIRANLTHKVRYHGNEYLSKNACCGDCRGTQVP